jgi:hypothetical protein
MSELARTYLAALAAGTLAFVMVTGLGLFLVPGATGGAVIAGVVAAVLGIGLLLGAARRSGHLDREQDRERRLLDPEGTRAPRASATPPDEDDRG